MWEAGSLIFRIMTVGRQQNEQDQRAAEESFKKTGKAAQEAGQQVDASGDATDRASKRSRDAKAPLEEQAKSQRKVGDESKKSSEQQDSQSKATEKQIGAAKHLAAALAVAGVAVAALVGLSVAKYAEFDQAMSQTAAATMATAAEQRELSEAALDAGADTAYSATEAAAAEEELAKAGISVADIVGGSLNGALALAAAGQLQVARSAEIMATTLKQYKLPAEDASHVSDLLAAGAGKAQGSVDDLANALKFVGPVAAGLGISLEETTGILALFAEQGIIGEQAGTSLRGVLSSLTSPSKIAADTMKQYGIEIFNANGSMKTGAQIAQELQDAFKGLTEAERSQALGRIFGNEQITAARILYDGGAAAVEEWTAAVDDSGYAAEQAAMRQDNLAGDVEKLGGAFDTALIRTGSGANDVLRDMVQALTGLVDIFGEAPDDVQQTVLVLGVATAAVLLMSGATVGLRAKYLELKQTMDSTNASMGRTALVGAAAGLALTGVVLVLGAWAQAHAEAEQRVMSFRDSLDQASGDITKDTREIAIAALQADQSLNVLFGSISRGNAADAAEKLGISLDTVADAVLGNKDAYEELSPYLQAAQGDTAELEAIERRTGLGRVEALSLLSLLADGYRLQSTAVEEAQRKQEQANGAQEEGVAVTQSAAAAYVDAANGASDLESELSDLIDTINAANGVGQDAISANIGYQDALAKVDEAISKAREGQEGYALTLDQGTQAGRDNLGMLTDLADRSQKAAEAQFALDGNTDTYRATLEAGRQALIDRATSLGYNAEQASALADQIYRIPSQTEWNLIAQTQAATTEISRFVADAERRIIRIGVTTYAKDGPQGQIRISASGRPDQYADGGVNIRGVRYYANGGAENHIAQMARAGEYRVWAEPETGGESYIPHAASKRAGADRVMADTAAILGGVYIPAGSVGVAAAPGRSSSPESGMQTVQEHIHLYVEGRQVSEAIRTYERSIS